jgi:endonuclease/exonuclease/phosphatase family metal-dependent hydrolase
MRRILALLTLLASSLGAEPLRVMSFNVRYPASGDGDNRWELRRDLLVATIREKNPDVLGTQELFHEQGQYIVEKAPEYTWFGVSRRGNQTDEHMGIFYRKDRLKLIESGNFWLSETPETPGSMSWNVSLPRMVTWGRFQIAGTRKHFYLYNTHFPHRGEDHAARLECARLIAARLGKLPKKTLVILTGDFNAAAGQEVYKTMAAGMRDAWLEAPAREGPEGTFNGFRGRTDGARIDWILYRGAIKTQSAEIVRKNDNGRYPSDHFPVFAVLDLN